MAIRDALDACPPHRRGWEWRLLRALGDGGEPLLRCATTATCMAITPDGETLVAGGTDRVEVWDLPARVRRYSRETGGHVQFVAVHAGEELLAATTANGYLHVWDLPTGVPQWGTRTQDRSPLVFDRGFRLHCVLPDHAIATLDAASGAVLATLSSDGHEVHRIALDPLRRSLAVAGSNGVRLFDIASLAERWSTSHQSELVTMLEFDPLGRALHVGLDHGRCLQLRAADGTLLDADRARSRGRVIGAQTMWRGQLLGPLDCWLALGMTPRLPVCGHPDRQTSLAAHPTRPWLLSGCVGGDVRLWASEGPQVRRALPGRGFEILKAVLSPDATRVATSGWDPLVHVWDVATGRHLLSIQASADPKRALQWMQDGSGLLGVGPDRHLHEWDAATGKSRRRFSFVPGWASPLTLSPDGDRALSADHQNQVVVFDLTRDAATRIGLVMRVCPMKWAPGGGEFYVADPGHLYRYDAATVRRTADLALRGVSDAIASPDGKRLFCSHGSGVSTVEVSSFSIAAQTERAVYVGGGFTPGGDRLITATPAGEVQVLDPADCTPLLRLLLDPRGTQATDISSDGRVFVMAGLSGDVTCLSLPEEVAGPADSRTQTPK